MPPPIAPNPALNGKVAPFVANTYDHPDDRDNIAPRVGFAWNVYGDGKTVLRGGFGLYYGRIVNSNILQTYEESGATNAAGNPLGQINYDPLYVGATCGPNNTVLTYPNLIAGPCAGTPNVAYLDSDMRNPQVDETDLALEQDLGHNTTLGITYMGSFGHDLPTAINVNYNPLATAIIPWAIGAPASSTPLSSYPVSPNSEAPPAPPSIRSLPTPAAIPCSRMAGPKSP